MSRGGIGVFIDRDGTLNEERPYISNPDDLVLIPGAGEAVRRLNEHGIATCIISNQSGIARGFFSEDTLASIHRKLEVELHKRGARVDRIFYCPHHPTVGSSPYRVECNCRKPRPGMILRGIEEFNLNPSASFVVGDSTVDMEAGHAAGTKTILVLTGYGNRSRDEWIERGIPVGAVVPTIVEAIDTILKAIDDPTTTPHDAQ